MIYMIRLILLDITANNALVNIHLLYFEWEGTRVSGVENVSYQNKDTPVFASYCWIPMKLKLCQCAGKTPSELYYNGSTKLLT